MPSGFSHGGPGVEGGPPPVATFPQGQAHAHETHSHSHGHHHQQHGNAVQPAEGQSSDVSASILARGVTGGMTMTPFSQSAFAGGSHGFARGPDELLPSSPEGGVPKGETEDLESDVQSARDWVWMKPLDLAAADATHRRADPAPDDGPAFGKQGGLREENPGRTDTRADAQESPGKAREGLAERAGGEGAGGDPATG